MYSTQQQLLSMMDFPPGKVLFGTKAWFEADPMPAISRESLDIFSIGRGLRIIDDLLQCSLLDGRLYQPIGNHNWLINLSWMLAHLHTRK